MKKKIKVLMVAPYYLTGIGGLEYYVKNISHGLQKRGIEIVVLTTDIPQSKTPRSKKTDKQKKLAQNTRIYRLPVLFKMSNSPFHPKWFWQVKNIINKEKPDVIIAHTPVPFLSDIAALVRGKVPYILTYHAGFTPLGRGIAVDLFTKIYEHVWVKLILSISTRIISSSEYVAKTVLRDFKNKTITITPGVDTKEYLPSNNFIKNSVLFVGSLKKSESYKDLDTLISAMILVTRKIKNAKLVVVGDGDNLKYYKNVVKEKGLNNVIFKGKLVDKEKVREFKKCHIYAHPSLFDSCPLVVLEAMASGKPVIGTNTTGIPYLVHDGETGILFPPKNVQSLSNGIIKLFKNPKLASTMGINARYVVMEKYQWENKVEKTIALINEIV